MQSKSDRIMANNYQSLNNDVHIYSHIQKPTNKQDNLLVLNPNQRDHARRRSRGGYSAIKEQFNRSIVQFTNLNIEVNFL